MDPRMLLLRGQAARTLLQQQLLRRSNSSGLLPVGGNTAFLTEPTLHWNRGNDGGTNGAAVLRAVCLSRANVASNERPYRQSHAEEVKRVHSHMDTIKSRFVSGGIPAGEMQNSMEMAEACLQNLN